MSVTVTLPIEIDLELESLLSRKAASEGMTVGEFATRTLRHAAKRPTIREVFADVRADIQARGITDEELEQDIDAAVAEVRARRRA